MITTETCEETLYFQTYNMQSQAYSTPVHFDTGCDETVKNPQMEINI